MEDKNEIEKKEVNSSKLLTIFVVFAALFIGFGAIYTIIFNNI